MKEKIEFLNMTKTAIFTLKEALIEIKESLGKNKDFNNFVSIPTLGTKEIDFFIEKFRESLSFAMELNYNDTLVIINIYSGFQVDNNKILVILNYEFIKKLKDINNGSTLFIKNLIGLLDEILEAS